MSTTERVGAGRYLAADDAPPETSVTAHELTTVDGASVSGLLRTVPGATTVAFLMHPRNDFSHHVLVPEFLKRGYAVWTQGSRTMGNDLTLLHEQALLDMAAGHVFLRERGFASVVSVGHSGGGALAAFYAEQAGLPASQRLSATPGGKPVPLPDAEMPLADLMVLMAPHPGQGELLLRMIDPSVTDEDDPRSVDPALDPYSGSNGFAPAPEPSVYSPEFNAPVSHGSTPRPARGSRGPARRRADSSSPAIPQTDGTRWPRSSSRCTGPTRISGAWTRHSIRTCAPMALCSGRDPT